MKPKPSYLIISMGLALTLGLAGCNESSKSSQPAGQEAGDSQQSPGGNTGPVTPPVGATGRTFHVAPGPQATADMVTAMIQLRPGDTLEFGCGFFDIDQGLLIQATEDVRVQGCGKDETVLSFRNSENVTGLEALNVRGITVEGLTILDSPGDAFKLKGVKWGTLRGVRALWSGLGEPITEANYQDRLHVPCTAPPMNAWNTSPDYIPNPASGRYGIYPVESQHILVEDSESVGASDAGIYVGQTNNAIIRTSRAAYNVMGFEIENVQGGEYDRNLAECNTGGFLIYDLENLTQYGDTSVMLDNIARNNNTYNFAPGGIVGAVPRGTGFITLGYDNIEIRNNLFEDHSTAAVIYTSYELIDGKGKTADRKLDPYTEGLHIHNNIFRNSGYSLPPPDIERLLNGEIETILPTLIGFKNLKRPGHGAHIVWDGLLDSLHEDCPYPLDNQGNPVPALPNGKPDFNNNHPNPSCHYNAYKFDNQGKRKQPEWGSCIHSNQFQDGQPYLNFHGTSGLELLLGALEQDTSLLSLDGLRRVIEGILNFPADTRLEDHDCQARFGRVLPPLPRVVIPPFERSGQFDPAPSEEQVNRLCGLATQPGQINRAALAVNCPRLEQYNLFADPQDPRSQPNEGGVPFVMNSKLFSDYATKYRVAFIPPGQQAIWQDGQQGSNLNGSIIFPEGTVIAKSFAFTDEQAGTEDVIETRLLIKRTSQSGKAFWDGLPYIWETDAQGNQVAKLAMSGGSTAASWHYRDADSGELLVGSTPHYSIPNANQCLTCHANDDLESGSAPIGPKPRNLNRAYAPESSHMGNQGQAGFPRVNQLQYWVDMGLLANAPSLQIDGRGVAVNVERLPHWNLPGDGGATPHSAADVESRIRAYMEINCQHCHNDKGAASNTGYYLDHFREVNASYGICKRPTATGNGSCGLAHVVVPGDANASILTCRMSDAHDPQKKMPPIAKSVNHDEAVALLKHWITNVVTSDYANGEACGGGAGGILPGDPGSWFDGIRDWFGKLPILP